MMKTKEMLDPKSCFNKALPEETMFIVLERDRTAPATIRFWASERIRLGLNVETDFQIQEAYALALEMEKNYLATKANVKRMNKK